MSGFVRTLQRTIKRSGTRCRAPHYFGRGSRLGVTNPKAKGLLARTGREKRRRDRS